MQRILGMAAAAVLAFTATALAAGEGGGNSSPVTHNCKTGQVWNNARQKCVKAQSGVLPDEELYQQGRALAKEGHYDWALEVLAVIQNQEDPRVLNYTGYSHRKAGRLDIGISYYQKALALNPNFNLAREYLGEGYVAAGRVDLAQAQLSEIAQRCGTTCEEYQDLAEAIATAN